MYITSYIVTGSGYFPLDMLRYDCSFPADSQAVDNIDHPNIYGGHNSKVREVKLQTMHQYKSHGISIERWNSFGWSVKIISTWKA